MSTQQSVILLEFNELVPALIHRFIGQGKLPNFERLYSESQVYTTDAKDVRIPRIVITSSTPS